MDCPHGEKLIHGKKTEDDVWLQTAEGNKDKERGTRRLLYAHVVKLNDGNAGTMM